MSWTSTKRKALKSLLHWSHMHPTHSGDGSRLDILNVLFSSQCFSSFCCKHREANSKAGPCVLLIPLALPLLCYQLLYFLDGLLSSLTLKNTKQLRKCTTLPSLAPVLSLSFPFLYILRHHRVKQTGVLSRYKTTERTPLLQKKKKKKITGHIMNHSPLAKCLCIFP